MTETIQLSQLVRQSMDRIMHRSWQDQMHFVKNSGLSMPQFSIMMQLHYQHQCGISDISDRMEISAAAASQLVDKLVHAGLIERIEDPVDRRAKKINLSEKGQELIRNGLAARHRWVGTFVEHLDSSEQEKVAEVMHILADTLEQLREQKQTD